jgi:ferredoxin
MANLIEKLQENVAGMYYVDHECIDCDLCRLTAPANFKRSEEAAFSFVFKQPSTSEEKQLCDQAKAECPVDAIGDDGDESN